MNILFNAFIQGLLVGSIAMSFSYIAYLLYVKFKTENEGESV